jgi:acetylornithine deacetylase/succinyl-diaminopimelate desuccinylase-like protein
MLDAAIVYSRRHQQQHLEALFEFLRIPSISTSSEHEPDIHRAATWLTDAMQKIGLMQVAAMPTAGYPVVYGEWLGAGPSAPTVLLYGHYDVQPVDPVSEWLSPPFEPTIRGDNLYCRGATDDKGQAYAVLAAADAYLRTAGRLPVNLKVMLEGEEEISSPNLAPWVREHQSMLACDAVLICDSNIMDVDLPMICYGTRGMAYMEIEVRGPSIDLHSGSFGGVVDNPFNVLVRLLAQLQDGATREVLIPGFYDKVRPLDAEEQRLLAEVPFGDAEVRALTGVPQVAGEAGFTTMERVSVRPTLDIHGMPGGFVQPGKKTVIPAKATVKVSMRLVPDQVPEEIAELFERQVRALTPPTVTVEVRRMGLARPSMVDFSDPAVQAAAEAYKRAFGAAPVYQRGGGTLPIVPDFQDILGAPVVMMGFGLPDDNAHAPNEKVHLPTLYRGTEAVIHYFALLAEQRDLR